MEKERLKIDFSSYISYICNYELNEITLSPLWFLLSLIHQINRRFTHIIFNPEWCFSIKTFNILNPHFTFCQNFIPCSFKTKADKIHFEMMKMYFHFVSLPSSGAFKFHGAMFQFLLRIVVFVDYLRRFSVEMLLGKYLLLFSILSLP